MNVIRLEEIRARDGQTDWGFVSSNEGPALFGCGEEGTEPKGKASDLRVDLHSNPHLWSRHLGSDQRNDIIDTSG